MSTLKVITLQPSTNDKSLTPEDIKLIQNSWNLMKQDIKANGNKIKIFNLSFNLIIILN